ncbi:MAG: hypothetical protein JO043_04275 [Candidatus Eremiobacteraeota bacterium]|nr:hypothetical protein [Candidatus Eremiobacteraeota bacterium]
MPRPAASIPHATRSAHRAYSSLAQINAEARAEGNRHKEAVQLGRALLVHPWPAQVLKVRVDGVDSHAVAGLVLSGVKFHGALDENRFLAEVAALAQRTFAASPVEEVDIWTTVPISVGKGAIVAGDFAQPTTRIVFSVTLRRAEATKGLSAKLRDNQRIFWDPPWRATLHHHKSPR